MMPNSVFEQTASILVEKTSLSAPQARGSIRLALKKGGCTPQDVTLHQMVIIFRNIMPNLLKAQGLNSEQASNAVNQIVNKLEKITIDKFATSVSTDAAKHMFDRIDREIRK
ncbi:MAG: hypothetical protein JW841_13505 [Deltaproteobacteria bacterium]|nr:hypothetical protein [Deltaproteobacteria bacterium]